jgi:hypothetical protein
MGVSYKSNLKGVLGHYERATKDWLSECGDIGLESINQITPEDTGLLKSQNKVEKSSTSVRWYNDTSYAAHVEYGTYKMSTKSFMRRGIARVISTFTSIIRRYF